jgi:pyruvate dehydrogenase E1 component alpha subunit
MENNRELQLYEMMFRIRTFEEKIISVYPKQDMKTPVHLCIGQEAVAAGIGAHLTDQDMVFSTHRGHGHYLAKHGDLLKLTLELYGKKAGACGGRGGSMHLADPDKGMPGFTAIVAGGIPIAVGAAFAQKYRGENSITCSFFGDGAVDEGTFYESLNFAALHDLPIMFVCENNLYATASHVNARHAVHNLPEKARSFGVEGYQVDGNAVMDVYNLAAGLITGMRQDPHPVFIECLTYRWKGHVGPEEDYLKGIRPESELTEWKQKCPLKRFRARAGLGASRAVPGANHNIDDIETRVRREIDEVFTRVADYPDQTSADLLTNLFCEPAVPATKL